MCYINWHDVHFRDAKHDYSESPYELSKLDVEHDDSGNNLKLHSTCATGSSSKQPAPSHYVFQTITLNPSTFNSQAVVVANMSLFCNDIESLMLQINILI
jgi:hypothetical protein